MALDRHAHAAKAFRDAGVAVRQQQQQHDNGEKTLSESLLLLSQSHAKSAMALRKFIQLEPSKNNIASTIRGALGTKKEADISDSMFLGRASSSTAANVAHKPVVTSTITSPTVTANLELRPQNPVDDMYVCQNDNNRLVATQGTSGSLLAFAQDGAGEGITRYGHDIGIRKLGCIARCSHSESSQVLQYNGGW